ncbi:DUF6959 family protein [Ruegeria discodermiae]|uniref:DUF6959 family protein n=1 Tax=Ruegeria discodermiae TaxID=3064389 RepID=UPI003532709B
MREELVEIYSDETNATVLRHPRRKFPGVLLQGDTLHNICQRLDFALKDFNRGSSAYDELNEIRKAMAAAFPPPSEPTNR